jgi:hypothetical protein
MAGIWFLAEIPHFCTSWALWGLLIRC